MNYYNPRILINPPRTWHQEAEEALRHKANELEKTVQILQVRVVALEAVCRHLRRKLDEKSV
jgi:hypothetical protein